MNTNMDYHIDKECSALGGLFQTIINDMKTQAPIWDDFINKASKLHTTLRTTIFAIGTFLEAFQRVADMATNTRGATREIGSALTRLCMRHRSIEQKLKVFTSSIMDLCVNPLQERMEEWKKTVLQLDKDHAKEYKKARNEIKKASSDTIRLQKKVRKGKNDMQNKLDSALQEVNDKFLLLEETEKNAVRTALIEERNRFCLFISCLKPVVDEEIAMLTEITHLQEVIDALCMQAGDPDSLPPSSEQVIIDLKTMENHGWSFQVSKTPPSSPSSLGSRKSSMCSISSMNSSSSGSTKSHSPSHHLRHRASSQTVVESQNSQILEVPNSESIEAQNSETVEAQNSQPPIPGNLRLSSVSSQDSGFTSQDTLFQKNLVPSTNAAELEQKKSVHECSSTADTDSNSSTPSPSHYSGPPQTSASTWSNWPDPPNQQVRPGPDSLALPFDRPHTISTAYERHARPALTAQTFEPPEVTQADRPISATAPSTPSPYAVPVIQEKAPLHLSRQDQAQMAIYASATTTTASHYAAPCIVPPPRPDIKAAEGTPHKPPAPPPGPKPRVKAVSPPVVPDFNSSQSDQSKKKNGVPQPVYVNMNELAHMAVAKQKESEEIRREVTGDKANTNLPIQLQEGSPYARPSIAKCQRSISMPVQDKHPLIEELTQRTAALRKQSPQRSVSPHRQASYTVSDSKNPEGRELADAIKELEASTAALQMVYEGGGNGQPGSRHSVAGYGAMLTGPDGGHGENSDDSELDLPPYPSHFSNTSYHSGYGIPVYAVPTRAPLVTRSQSFRLPPTTHRQMSNPGVPPVQGGAVLRRGSLPNKPPTPVRRTSSISSGMSSIPAAVPGPATTSTPTPASKDGERSGSNTPTPQGTPTRHRRTTSELTRTPSDRPPDVNMRHSFAAPSFGNSDDDDDDDGSWPPPPPADFMVPLDQESSCSSTSTVSSRGSRGSVSDTHADVIHTLNAVFRQSVPSTPPGPQAWHPASLPLVSSTSNQSHTRSLSQSSDDITPTAENPSPDNFLCQIKRGVSLRRTQSNDRSAPRIPSHPR